jgi:hypothetical protein
MKNVLSLHANGVCTHHYRYSPHLLFSMVENVKRSNIKPNIISLFSGCGGLDLGFEKAGYIIL